MIFRGAPYAIGITGTLVDRIGRLVVLRPDYLLVNGRKVFTNELLLAEYRCHEYGRGASFDNGLLGYATISHRKIQNFPRNMAELLKDYFHRFGENAPPIGPRYKLKLPGRTLEYLESED